MVSISINGENLPLISIKEYKSGAFILEFYDMYFE
jgi:hypothetical protein